MSSFKKQLSHLNKARQKIPGCAQTISKFPFRFPVGAYPIYITKAQKNYLCDMDGNKYLDWTSGLGTNLLGYNNTAVEYAIRDQLQNGINYSLSSELEYVLVDKLSEMIPSAKMVRLFKTGSDSCNAAVRVANAFTNKDTVAVSKECYHGTGDIFALSMDYHNGVPTHTDTNNLEYFEYNDIESVRKLVKEKYITNLSSIILEPSVWKEPDIDFLSELREMCTDNDIILIFDEMVTGFRSPKFSIQAYTGIIPDLSCFGKSLGNGMPISAICGREDIMQLFDVDNTETPVFYSGTYFGECLSIAASIAVLDELKRIDNSSYPSNIGNAIKRRVETESIEGEVGRFRYKYPDSNLYKSVFMQELAEKGILIGNVVFPNYEHSLNDSKHTADIINETKKELEVLTNHNLGEMLKGQECKNFSLRR